MTPWEADFEIICFYMKYIEINSQLFCQTLSSSTAYPQWPGTKELGGPSMWRSGMHQSHPSTCSTPTASVCWSWGLSSTFSGAQTTLTTGSLGSSWQSSWSWSGKLSVTLSLSWKGLEIILVLLENTLVSRGAWHFNILSSFISRRLHSEYFWRYLFLCGWVHYWHCLCSCGFLVVQLDLGCGFRGETN